MTTPYEQAWDEVYGTPEAWERERHGTARQAENERYRLARRDIYAQELADTREGERLRRSPLVAADPLLRA